MAANISLEEIRSSCYINDHYEVPDLTKENMFNGVPKTLKAFLEIVIKTHKEKNESNQVKYDKKIATLAHCIISSTRPRSFTSPILVSLSSMIHKKYAKGLIDSLSNVGLIASYKEVLKFEASIINDPANHTLTEDAYIQFVYYNADHNTCTIDGRNTFHAMSGIMIATPSSSVVSKKSIEKLKKIPSSKEIGKTGFVELKHFEKKSSNGLKSICIENIYDESDNRSYEISMQDLTWFYSKFSNKFSDGWNGFMKKLHMDFTYEASKNIPLPFVNNPPQ
ncbi:hypothetical protein ALC57_13768 [Trachymyrmex cornetzi]|uniref:Uncharacterized protein n=1 Tax=Trachymyrmex cornetzi TaxID=471704 RepID=A0A151IZ35_9HYME|nr:hypothetical protein ALC57_13768 [Trachymyrmex cornetzi]